MTQPSETDVTVVTSFPVPPYAGGRVCVHMREIRKSGYIGNTGYAGWA